MNRRRLLQGLVAVPFGAGLAGVAGCASRPAPVSRPADLAAGSKRGGALGARGALGVLCVGAHPDDPECGCGGTLARLAKAGHGVTVLYLTRGENDAGGRSFDENGRIRAREAEAACSILGVKARFFGMRGGSCEITTAWRDRMTAIFDELAPDIVFAHWPLDTNPDHQIASMLAVHAYLAKPRQNPLYFFEVETGRQTVGFEPHVFVEIGDVLQTKSAAVMAHASQSPERLYEVHHEPMERFRAREIGGVAAEAFATMPGTLATGFIPGL